MKNKILKVAALSFVLLLTGCGKKVTTKPANAKDPLVTFTDNNKDYFRNDIQKVYDQLTDSGEYNTITLNRLIDAIVADKVTNSNFFNDFETLKKDLIEDELLAKIKSDTYKVDGLFSEAKFINAIKNSLYKVNVTDTHEGILIKPDTTVADILGENYRTVYADYIDNEILPDINKKLLTAKYICENSFSSLGRAYARDLSYVKLENIEKKPGAAGQLINKWLGDFVNNKVTTTDKFSLDSLARIYKGIAGENANETAYINGDYYTLSDEIKDEIGKVCDVANGYAMKADADIDKDIEDKYTSNGTYTLAWGHELALRNLSSKKISDNNLFTKTVGISDLPNVITDRLFSSSVSSYLEKVKYTPAGSTTEETVAFLTPATSENGTDLGKYYFYDSTTDAYYIVVVNNYEYTSTNLKKKVSYKEGTDEIKSVDIDVAKIAVALSSSSTFSSESILAVLKEYKVAEHIHDETFYDYMKDNYSDLF